MDPNPRLPEGKNLICIVSQIASAQGAILIHPHQLDSGDPPGLYMQGPQPRADLVSRAFSHMTALRLGRVTVCTTKVIT